MKLKRIAGALGAEVQGVDLARDLNASLARELNDLWLEHQVIFFREQRLDSPAYLRFAQAMGEPIEYPHVVPLPGYPTITPVIKLPEERKNFGGIWHSDTSYLEVPPKGTMLLAREVPPQGGDTMFASQYLAYEALSAGLQRMLSGLRAISSTAKADTSGTREDKVARVLDSRIREVTKAEHPVVRTHPETGRKALYISAGHTIGFAGMSETESAPLLKWLFEHQIRPEFTCRFHWSPGSLALWDNRCVMHFPINDYHGHKREMHRITLAGTRPV